MLLHLKSLHPLWKIFEKCTTGGVWIFKCTYLLCDFSIRFCTEGVNILFRIAKWAYLLGICTPCRRYFLNLPHGVCEIQMSCQFPCKWRMNMKWFPSFIKYKIIPYNKMKKTGEDWGGTQSHIKTYRHVPLWHTGRCIRSLTFLETDSSKFNLDCLTCTWPIFYEEPSWLLWMQTLFDTTQQWRQLSGSHTRKETLVKSVSISLTSPSLTLSCTVTPDTTQQWRQLSGLHTRKESQICRYLFQFFLIMFY